MDASIVHQQQKSWKEAMESLRSKSRLIHQRHDEMTELLNSVDANEHEESSKECKEKSCEVENKKEALPSCDNHFKTQVRNLLGKSHINDTKVSDDDIDTDLSVCSAVTVTPFKSPTAIKQKKILWKKRKRVFLSKDVKDGIISQTLRKRIKRKYGHLRQPQEDENNTWDFSYNDNNNLPRKRLRMLSTSFSNSPLPCGISIDVISLIDGDENEKTEDDSIKVFDVDATFNKIEETEKPKSENPASEKDEEVSQKCFDDGIQQETNDEKKRECEENSSFELISETEQENKDHIDEENDSNKSTSLSPSSTSISIWSTKTEEHDKISSNGQNPLDPNPLCSTRCQSPTPPARKLTLDSSSNTDILATKCNPIPDSDSEIFDKPLEAQPVSKEVESEQKKSDEKSSLSALILPKNTDLSNDETKSSWEQQGEQQDQELEQQQQQQPSIQVFYLVANKENYSLLQELKGISSFSTTTTAAALNVSNSFEQTNAAISVPPDTKPLLENAPYSQDLTLETKKQRGRFGGFVLWIASSVCSYFTILIIHFVISTFIRENILK